MKCIKCKTKEPYRHTAKYWSLYCADCIAEDIAIKFYNVRWDAEG